MVLSASAEVAVAKKPLRVVLKLARPLNPGLLAELAARGVTVEARADKLMLIRALLPPAGLAEVAALPEISFIRRPYRPLAIGTQVQESLGPIGAVLLHAHKFKGQGVRVAVIDVGFADLSWAISRGVLPREALADATDYTGEGLETGTNHGTAVAELVHAVAPEALLYLKKIGDEVDLANAVDDSLRQGIKIIVHSVGWFNTNFTDGRGIVCQLADRAERAGILWVNAAGNHAQQHWTGPFRDLDGDGWVEFQGSQEELKVRAGFGELQLFLTWDDWPHTCQDYDLFLYDLQGNLVASSQNYQTCSEPPTEELYYLPLQAVAPGVYYIRVLARNRLKPVALKIFSANARLEPAVPQGSLPAPADARGVLAVGAIPIGLWETGPTAAYSSQGPTSDGRIKPDLVAPDNVRTATEVGFLHRFQGTSAAAPQVAGAAALILSQHSEWTAAEVREALETTAVDMGPPGKDNIYGAGRLSLSLGRPRAVREITSPIRPGDQAVQGDSPLVTIRLVMPPSHFGGLVFQERIPPGFRLIPVENAGAEFDPERLIWSWPIVEPGSGRTISYKLIIPPDQPPGSYRLGGRLNGEAVEGEAEFRVIPPMTVAEAVAHWDAEEELIDLKLCDRIERAQLEQAISWWLAGSEVPATGGKAISSDELERLIAYHLTGTPVGSLLPSLPAWGAALARRIVTPKGDGSLVVRVEIEAHSRIYGLRLSEDWPSGWEIEPLDHADVIFNGSEIEWLWSRIIEPGEVLSIRYLARPPTPTGPEVEIRGIISSALPRFNYSIGGLGRAELKLEIPDPKPRPKIGAVRVILRGKALEFRVEGDGIEALRLRLFDLSGLKIYDSGWVRGQILSLTPGSGEIPANGVYLYLLSGRGTGGEELKKSGKVAILR